MEKVKGFEWDKSEKVGWRAAANGVGGRASVKAATGSRKGHSVDAASWALAATLRCTTYHLDSVPL